MQADIEALRSNPAGRAPAAHRPRAPGRRDGGPLAGARAGPLALVPGPSTPGNGELAERVVRDLAQLVDADLAGWLEDSVAVVSTMVDRITPRAGPEDFAAVLESTGFDDRCPVVSEPFHEWGAQRRVPRWAAALAGRGRGIHR